VERLPFPAPRQRPSDLSQTVDATPGADDGLVDLWRSLTLGGRVAVCFVAVLVAVGLVAVFGDAVFGGVHGDQEGGVLFVFVALIGGLLLGVVIGLDGAFRSIRERRRSSKA
jgi:Flp pilus assembly pilin Flp